MKTYEEILKRKIDHYGETKAAYHFAAEEYASQRLVLCSNESKLYHFVFVKASEVHPLADMRALVKTKDDKLHIAIWSAEHRTWCDEGAYLHSGGIGGDITDEVVEFSLIE